MYSYFFTPIFQYSNICNIFSINSSMISVLIDQFLVLIYTIISNVLVFKYFQYIYKVFHQSIPSNKEDYIFLKDVCIFKTVWNSS